MNALTRDASEQYAAYIERVAERPRSARVKVADLHDNLGRLAGLPQEDQERLGPRYRAALLRLGGDFRPWRLLLQQMKPGG